MQNKQSPPGLKYILKSENRYNEVPQIQEYCETDEIGMALLKQSESC